MSARQPRFEICRGDDGWWARFRAANGRVVWVTETYERRRGADEAVRNLMSTIVVTAETSDDLEVREVDER